MIYPRAIPFVTHSLAIRKLKKDIAVLKTKIDRDGRFRAGYRVAGTDTGRWCVTKDHEVLTKTGWISIADWNGNDEIMVYDAVSGTLRFASAKKLQFKAPANLWRIKSKRFRHICTSEHRLIYKDSHNAIRAARAEDNMFLPRALLGGVYAGTFRPEEQTRACIMMQAAGHIINSKRIRFYFRKQRKIERCKHLLDACGIPWQESIRSDGSTYIHLPKIDWLATAKYFGPWLFEHDPKIIVEEALLWDGNGDEYLTTVPENAEWFQTICHLVGKSATIRVKQHACGRKDLYRVRLQNNNAARVHKKDYAKVQTDDALVYCPQTPTGFFLTRCEGRIMVTGNSSAKNAFGTGSNAQNITDKMRRAFIPDLGMKMCYADLEQAESRIVGIMSGVLFDEWSYYEACLSGDLHTKVCKMVWTDLGWTGNPEEDRKVADQHATGRHSYRDLAKRLGHGSNYLGTPRTMAKHTAIPEALAREFQRRYFEAFPGIRMYGEWIKEQLKTKGYLTTPLGRTRHFFGRLTDADTIRKAVAFIPQSSIGDQLNRALLAVWKAAPDLGIELLAQVHDAILFQYPFDREAEVIPKVVKIMEQPFTFGGREFTIPVEAQVGYNWAHKSEKNPNGLHKYELD